jgi:hypothetical protein
MSEEEKLLRIYANGSYLKLDSEDLKTLYIRTNVVLQHNPNLPTFLMMLKDRFFVVHPMEQITLQHFQDLLNE